MVDSVAVVAIVVEVHFQVRSARSSALVEVSAVCIVSLGTVPALAVRIDVVEGIAMVVVVVAAAVLHTAMLANMAVKGKQLRPPKRGLPFVDRRTAALLAAEVVERKYVGYLHKAAIVETVVTLEEKAAMDTSSEVAA